jgi:hypothetical protein
MLVCNSGKNDAKAKNSAGIVNNNFILDTSLGNEHGTLRETKFFFPKEADGYEWNEWLIDYFPLGNISVFHTFRHINGVLQETPVYYINNETEEIIAQ